MWQKVKHQIGNYLPALRSPNYRLYFAGQGISLIGTWMQAIAEQWLIYPILTNNRSLLGIVSAVNLFPTAALVLVAGVIADRIDKQRGVIIQQSLYTVITFIMFFLVFTGRVAVWHVMAAALCMGIVFAFDMPTRQSLMIELVEKKDFASALSLNAAIFNTARAVGPAIAGALIAFVGIAPAYLINSLSFLAVIISVSRMKLPKKITSHTSPTSLRKGFMEGVSYIKTNKVVAVLLGILLLTTLFTYPTATLLPVFAHDIFHTGEAGFGMLQSAFGIGAVIAALSFYTLFGRVRDKFRLLISNLIVIFLANTLFSVSRFFPLSLFCQVVGGWAISSTIALVNTLIQSSAPSVLRGRLMSFYSFVLIGGMPFGALLASLGVGTIGPRFTISAVMIAFALCCFTLITATGGKLQLKLKEIV